MKFPRKILITGASSGIGEALARHYAAPEVTLALTGRNAERLENVAELCRAAGAVVHTGIIDVCDMEAMRGWILARDAEQNLDLVIANAGISGGTGLRGEDEAQVRAIFDTNVNGVFNTVLPILAPMCARGRGQIAVISSLAGFSGWPGAPAYGASKGAVRLYGEALREAVARQGVEINVVCPGFVESRMTDVNRYRMPFLMPADRAAKIISRRLERNQGRIAFPWPTYLIAGTMALLPFWIRSHILKKLPEKPARNSL
jgi:short-subunit dehydrogenase